MTDDEQAPSTSMAARSLARLWPWISLALLALVAVAAGAMLLRHDRGVAEERQRQLESIADAPCPALLKPAKANVPHQAHLRQNTSDHRRARCAVLYRELSLY